MHASPGERAAFAQAQAALENELMLLLLLLPPPKAVQGMTHARMTMLQQKHDSRTANLTQAAQRLQDVPGCSKSVTRLT
jgi:hypothetical protein